MTFTHSYSRVLALLGLSFLSACGGASSTAPVTPGLAAAAPFALQAQPSADGAFFRSCEDLLPGDYMRCFAEFAVSSGGAGRTRMGPDVIPSGYGPTQLAAAYDLPTATHGSGQTIGIVDAYNDPNIVGDLALYRSTFKLPACTTTSGCFKHYNEYGGTTYPADNGSWGQEQSLDVDMVSAICPNCHIILIEASSASIADFEKAENEAVALGAKVVSNSFGGNEYEANDPAYSHSGIVIVASSGDDGYAEGSQQPCSFQSVVCAGGTSLTQADNSRGWDEVVWPGGGSGCSKIVAKPSWQTDKGCPNRTQADVAFDSDPNTGVAVYDSYEYKGVKGWLLAGGTSVASPAISGVYGLAANGNSLGKEAAHRIWSNAGKGLNAVTSGRNGDCPEAYLYVCVAGTNKDGVYSGPAGWGSPDGIFAF